MKEDFEEVANLIRCAVFSWLYTGYSINAKARCTRSSENPGDVEDNEADEYINGGARLVPNPSLKEMKREARSEQANHDECRVVERFVSDNTVEGPRATSYDDGRHEDLNELL